MVPLMRIRWTNGDSLTIALRGKHISQRGVKDAMLYGRTTYDMLAPYWSAQTNDDHGPASKLNSVRKYVISSTLEQASWNNSTIIKGIS